MTIPESIVNGDPMPEFDGEKKVLSVPLIKGRLISLLR
jgi:hypothetical protein